MRDYSFGDFLFELRKRRGLSQYQLGMLVGVTDKAVSKWENGTSSPQVRTLHKLSEVLEVSTDELLACKYRSVYDSKEKGVFAMKKELWKKAKDNLEKIYGDNMPIEVFERYLSERAELEGTDAIIYFELLAKLKTLSDKESEHMYVRGVFGSSFITYLMGATNANPLKPHYYCPECKNVKFDDSVMCGWDLPKKRCECGAEYLSYGHDLPFETVKSSVPQFNKFHIDVSQGMFDKCKELIFEYFSPCKVVMMQNDSIATTFVVIDEDVSDVVSGEVLSFDANYAKLREYPMITLIKNELLSNIKLLEDSTKTRPKESNYTDSKMLDAIKRGEMQGLPSFETPTAKDILSEVTVSGFGDLIKLFGLIHGTGVWEDNAQTLIRNGKFLSEVFALREDVFLHIQKSLHKNGISSSGYAVKVMSDVCRGVYLSEYAFDKMKKQSLKLSIEDWAIDSIGKIRYCFPKAHSIEVIRVSLYLLWFKINYPDTFEKCETNKI